MKIQQPECKDLMLAFYKRSVDLPPLERTEGFLQEIPESGVVLDFGAGTARWAKAFMRDRLDLTIDILDKRTEQISLPEIWKGEVINSDFRNFAPNKKYDGVWAFASLFFLTKKELEDCFPHHPMISVTY